MAKVVLAVVLAAAAGLGWPRFPHVGAVVGCGWPGLSPWSCGKLGHCLLICSSV